PLPPHPSHLSLHDALPISDSGTPITDVAWQEVDGRIRKDAPDFNRLRPLVDLYRRSGLQQPALVQHLDMTAKQQRLQRLGGRVEDRKSTRLNSSHVKISYA